MDSLSSILSPWLYYIYAIGRYLLLPLVIAIATVNYKINSKKKADRRNNRRTILRFFMVVLEKDISFIKAYLQLVPSQALPLPLSSLPIKLSLTDISTNNLRDQALVDTLVGYLLCREQYIGRAVDEVIDREGTYNFLGLAEKSLLSVQQAYGDFLKNEGNDKYPYKAYRIIKDIFTIN